MTVPVPTTPPRPARRFRRRGRAVAAVVAGLVLAQAGCRTNKDGGGGAGITRNDPLMSDQRIPPTSVPLPDRGGAGARTKTDPLLGSPTSHPNDKSGATRTDDDRWKGPYIPGRPSTTAALSGRLPGDNSDLNLELDPLGERPVARPTGGGMLQPSRGSAATTGADRDGIRGDVIPADLRDELAALGVKPADTETGRQASGGYSFRARVPLGRNGATRQYEGVGQTLGAAVKQVVDQVQADRS